MTVDVLELARRRREIGEPFVLATVVWRRTPSSAKPGAKALISPDGTVTGWLGGACAEPAVAREAVRALGDGEARLMFLGPDEELAKREHDEGVVAVPIACQSEGAIEVYLEPEQPRQQLIAIGRSPAVDTLAGLAGALGWRTVVVDKGAHSEDHPQADLVLATLDLSAAGVGERSVVIVGTQGHYDEEALEHALATDVAYVGLIASRKRAESLVGYLRDRGASEESLARVHAPAGLDLGPLAPDEIAVSIIAELVQRRAAGEFKLRPPGPALVDPVCGMAVDVEVSPHAAEHAGVTYHFCSTGCRETFAENPAQHLAVTPSS